jgi:AcrR family transcriptional regulator
MNVAADPDAALDAPRRGRPRSVDCDNAILDAALEEYGRNGFEGMSVDAVAARAGVSKATIYRRFESKLELVTAAMYHVAEQRKPIPDTGTLHGDLHALLHNLVEMTRDQTLGCNVRMMVADGMRNPELGAVHEEFVRYRRSGTTTVFERAIARGELRAGIDLQVAADVLTGPVFYRHLVSHMPIDDDYVDALLEIFLEAFGASRPGAAIS